MKINTTFKEYADEELEKALSSDNKFFKFDIDGNSELATYHKPFLKSIKYHSKKLVGDIKYMFKKPFYEWEIGSFINLIIILPTFPLIVLLRNNLSKKRAEKELRKYYSAKLRKIEIESEK